MKKLSQAARSILLNMAGNESLFLFAAFLSVGVLSMAPLGWYAEMTDAFAGYVVAPWGMALCLLRLERRTRRPDAPVRADIAALFVLLMWMIVPFAIRFGFTFNNVSSWHGYAVVYFGVYAMVSEEAPERRERLFDLACALFGALSLAMGGALLYCAATVQAFGLELGGYGFGLCDGIYLCNGLHYNITGMIAVCCAMMSLAGCGRSRHVLGKVAYALAAAVMTAVIVLTQSRTARYALILALAAGCYSVVACAKGIKGTVKRQLAGIAAAALVAVLGYVGASALTDAALRHYEQVNAARLAASELSARAEAQNAENARMENAGIAPETAEPDPAAAAGEEPAQIPQGEPDTADAAVRPETGNEGAAAIAVIGADVQLEAREAVDATLSGRTDVWKNLFRLWREEPKHFLIGNGVGRTGSRVVEGTIHEQNGAVALHNTYLQFIADFGLVGFLLLCAFAAAILRPVLRVFFGKRSGRGYLPLCMLVLASLLTGMMESAPLGAMTPMNLALFFALALLGAQGRGPAQEE